MPQLTVNNNVFNYPDPGTDPGWGEEASGWAKAVTDVLNLILATGDILQTSFEIDNNINTDTDILRLSFDSSVVRAANITYSVIRTSDDVPSGLVESGTIFLSYDGAASPGSKWNLSQIKQGDAGIVFGVTDLGQITYKSTNVSTTLPSTYAGQIKFFAKTLSQ